MEDTTLKTFLCLGLLGWIRALVDRPSSAQVSELSAAMEHVGRPALYLITSFVLALLSVGGLIGMFFDWSLFRWFFLAGVIGMISATYFFPAASNKPKRDLIFAEVFRVIDGVIIALIFFT